MSPSLGGPLPEHEMRRTSSWLPDPFGPSRLAYVEVSCSCGWDLGLRWPDEDDARRVWERHCRQPVPVGYRMWLVTSEQSLYVDGFEEYRGLFTSEALARAWIEGHPQGFAMCEPTLVEVRA